MAISYVDNSTGVNRDTEVSSTNPLPTSSASTGATNGAALTDSTQAGTVIQWLKGLVKMFADVWSSTGHFFSVSLATRLDSTNDSISVAGVGIYAANLQYVGAALAASVDAAVGATAGLRLMGFNIQEIAGTPAAATFSIKRGATSAGGTLLASIKLAASQNVFVAFPSGGLKCDEGISITRTAGTADVILYYKVPA